MEDGNKRSIREYLHSGGSRYNAQRAADISNVAILNNYHQIDYSGVDDRYTLGLNESEHSLDSGIIDNIKNYFKREPTPGGVVDAYNLMQEKRLQGDLNATKNDITTLRLRKDEIEFAKNYISNQQELEKLLEEIQLLDADTNPNVYKQYEQRIKSLQLTIQEQEKIIKTEGKHSDILRSLFFDTTKSGNTESQLDSWLYSTLFDREAMLTFNEALSDIGSVYKNAYSKIKDAKNPLYGAMAVGIGLPQDFATTSNATIKGGLATVENLFGAAANLFNETHRVIRGDEFSNQYNGRIDEAIRESNTNDRTYDVYFRSANEINKNSSKTKQFLADLKYWEDDISDQMSQKIEQAQDISRKLLRGTWYFRPDLIDPRFREAQANVDTGLLGAITHPLYSFPEVGTSFSDFTDFAILTGTDAAISALTSEQALKWVAKKAGTVAIGGTLGKALGVASDFLSTAKGIQKVQMTAAALETVPNVYLTNQMRLNETKQEAFDAYSNKVLNQLFESGIDPRIVANAADQKWNELLSNLPEGQRVPPPESFEEKIGLAVTLGVDIGDLRWTNMLQDARRGLSKLYNENMSLAAKDYLEGMAFMPYAGKVMQKALYRSLETPLAYQTAELQQNLSTTKKLRPIVESGKASGWEKAQYYAHKFAEDKLSKNLNPTTVIAASRVNNFVKNKVKQVMQVAPLEGIEEGQQHLLLSRYESGQYDDYQRPESSFMDIKSLLNDQELAVEALGSYFGVNKGDPTNGDAELRRAMNIGFTTAMWFQVPGVATNVLPSRITHADNLRNLVAQVKTDLNLKRLVGENYAAVQDDQHVGKFFDMYSKAGITGERVANTLQEMKKYKGDLVDDAYIDEDIKLARATYDQYHSEIIDKERADRNIAKGSNEHKFMVQNAVREIRDFQRAMDLLSKNEKDLDTKNQQVLDLVLKEMNDFRNSGQSDYYNIGGRYGKFIQKALEDYKQVSQMQSSARENWQTDEQLQQDAISRLKSREHLTDEEARTNAIEEVRKWVFNDYTEAERKRGAKGMPLISEDEFVQNRLNAVLEYSKLPIYRKLISDLTKNGQLQKIIQEETGTDINTESLISIVDILKQRRDAIKKNADELVNYENSQIDFFNQHVLPEINKLRTAIGKKELKERSRTNISGIINKYGDVGLDEEFVRLISLSALNDAVVRQLAPRAQAYLYGATDPNQISASIRPRKFSELTEEQKSEYVKAKIKEAQDKGEKEPTRLQIGQIYNREQELKIKKFKELKKQYNNLRKNKRSFLDETLDVVERRANLAENEINEVDVLAVQLEAASLFIQQQLDEKIDNYQERLRIYHTQNEIQEEDATIEDTEITGEDDSTSTDTPTESPVIEGAPDENLQLIPDTDSSTIPGEMSDEMRDVLNMQSQGDTAAELAIASFLGENKAPTFTQSSNERTDEQGDTAGENISEEESTTEEEGEDVEDGTSQQDEVEDTPTEDTENSTTGETNEDVEGEDAPDNSPEEPFNEEDEVEENSIGDIEDEDSAAETTDEVEESAESIQVDDESFISESPEDEPYFVERVDDFSLDDEQSRRKGRVPKKDVQSTAEATRDHLASLARYQPESDKPMFLGVSNGEDKTTPLKTTYRLRSGKELAKKLLDKNWINTCEVYYICSGNLYQKGRKDKNTVTVSLIIDDHKEKKTYAMSFATPGRYSFGEKTGQMFDGRKNIIQTLEAIGLSDQNIIRDSSGRRSINWTEYNEKRKNILTGRYLEQYGDTPSSNNDLVRFERSLSREQLDDIDYSTRKAMSDNKSRVMTRQQIEEQIQNLIAARNQIIDAYCNIAKDGTITIPTTIRKDVKPQTISVSNGRFNNVTEDGAPVYQDLYEVDGLGLTSDTEQITQAINDGKVLFGFGRGKDAVSPYAISNITDPKLNFDISNRSGEAGKAGVMYVLVNTGNAHLVPIQLRTERFDILEGIGLLNPKHNPVKLCIDPTTGSIRTYGEVKPSLAELILFMMCNKLNLDEVLGRSQQIEQRLLDLIVNNGDNTLLSNDSRSQNEIPQLADKLFAIGIVPMGKTQTPVRCLIIANNEGGRRSQQAIPVENIFTDDLLRQEVVYSIARNLHWNTEVSQETKGTAMKDSFPADIMAELRGYFEDNPSATEYKAFGLDRLTFKKSDFFREEGGNLIQKDVNVLSWMIANGHLMTDLGKTVFRDPFVFAEGIASRPTLEKTKESLKEQGFEKKGNGVSIVDNKRSVTSRVTPEKIDKLVGVTAYGKTTALRQARINRLVAKTEQERQEILQRSTDLFDKVALAVQFHKEEGKNAIEAYKGQMETAVQEYLDYLNGNKLFDKLFTLADVMGLNIDNTKLQQSNRGYVPMLVVSKSGLINFTMIHSNNIGNEKQFTGVFSKVKHGDPLTDEEAREFLSKSLGIDSHNVLILDRVFDALTKKEVYGIMSVASDILSGDLTGQITISRASDNSSTYHEAFHYANLLLRTRKERVDLYKKFVESRRPDLKEAKLIEIEEAMAEDFKEYVQSIKRNEPQTVFGKVLKFFKDIWDTINIFKKKDLVKQVYDKITAGKYASRTIDPQSLSDFISNYPQGAFDIHTIPGMSQDKVRKLKHITDYKTFYGVSEALTNEFLARENIQTVGDLQKLSGNAPFAKLIDELLVLSKDDLYKTNLLNDVKSNIDVFKAVVFNRLQEYGIKGTTSKAKIDDLKVSDKTKEDIAENNNSSDTGDRDNPAHDTENFEVSKKDNVAFRAKLFLGQIEKRIFEYDELTGKKRAVCIPDKYLGLRQYETFGEAWTTLLNDMWMVESFDELDPNSTNVENPYAKTSLMYRVINLSKSRPFYTAVREKLESLDYIDEEGNVVKDIQLQNQILATIKSQKPTVGYLRVKTALQKKIASGEMDQSYDSSESVTASAKIPSDRDKSVEIFTDNTFRSKRMLPREWSKAAMVSGLVRYETKGGETQLILQKEPVMSLKERYDTLEKSLFDVIKKSGAVILTSRSVGNQQDAEELYNNSISQLVDIMNDMGIPSDEAVIENMILQLDASAINDYTKRVKALQSLLSTSTGSIRFLINNVMVPNIGNGEISYKRLGKKTGKKVGKAITSPINEIYYGYKDDTFITRYAETYASVYPTPSDFAVTSPEGKRIYPISQNNWISDTTRRLNYNVDGIVQRLLACPYQKRSLLLKDIAATIKPTDKTNEDLIRLVGFVGIKDADQNKGADYFGMTRMEDYISKMTMLFGKSETIGDGDTATTILTNRMMVLPTMADKKTYYGIAHNKLNTLLVDDDIIQADGSWRFSDKTLRVFYNYFLDELDTIEQYYSKSNIEYLTKNPGKRIKNYHGKFDKSTGRLDLSGNGGMFRYCYDFIIDQNTGLNLNEMIQAKLKAQQVLEQSNGKSIFRKQDDTSDLDGFESVREYLTQLRSEYSFANIKENINRHLVNLITYELDKLDSEPDLNLVLKQTTEAGITEYIPTKIPRDIIQYYSEKAAKKYNFNFKPTAYRFPSLDKEACVNAISNHVVNSIISMIEYEKIFSGDQAFYKWKYFGNKVNKTATVDGVTVSVKIIRDKNADRVKRLGAGLSPGDNVRANYGDEIVEQYPELASDAYTNAYIDDISYLSQYIDDVTNMFKIDRTVEWIRQNNPDWFLKFREDLSKSDEEFSKLSDEQMFNKFYLLQKPKDSNKTYFDTLFDSVPNEAKKRILNDVERQARPYKEVNVSDAQVLIRPDLYRKIRIGLGQWSFVEDATGYSDEKAYKILQKDDSWMKDAEKSAVVRRLLLFPLKMTYFDNAPETESDNANLARPRYNKMAIFPLFKYVATSKTGRQLYERMNRKNNELDMLTFDSAVKVGGNQDQPAPLSKNSSLDNLSDNILADSDLHLTDGVIVPHNKVNDKYRFPVQVQHLSRLLMQLNTEAHLDEERAIGTQMFKIAFSDIIDKALYGLNKLDSKSRTGREIKTEIMACIDALTNKGRQSILDQYLPGVEEGDSRQAVIRKLMKRIIRSNNLGLNLEDLVNGIRGTVASQPKCVESSSARRVFEQSIQSKVNSKVVEIHTNGGSAIQQSCFGFAGFDNVERYDQTYHMYNEGRPIKWNKKNGSMEVLLSMNFFKAVVPLKHLGSYSQMREWLVENDVIKGTKKDGTKSNPKPFGIGYRIPTQGMSSMFVFTVADVLPEQSGDLIIVPPEFTAQTGSDFDIDKLFLATMKYNRGEEESTLEKSDVFDQMLGKNSIAKKKAFNTNDVSEGAILNRLLQDYMDIISDTRNFSLSRASIDTFTSIILDEVLPFLNDQNEVGVVGMSELTPFKQSSIKLEFITGKQGIGPFALNITNHALTQYANLCMVYPEDNPYNLGRIDAITGEDGLHILGWLSAMVNAHVDVAKDPYIFTLNVNGTTYNMTNFLIRAGKGMSTFSFIGQPILKDYCRALSASGGFYGNNNGSVDVSGRFVDHKRIEQNKATIKYWNALVQKIKTDSNNLKQKDSSGNTLLDRIASLKVSKTGNVEVTNRDHLSAVFDTQRMLDAAKDINQNGLDASAESLYLQVLTMRAFKDLTKYADQLSQLVLNSRIDTKKFGKDKAEQYNFLNNYNQFRYNHGRDSVDWYINDGSKTQEQLKKEIDKIKESHDKHALDVYFTETFLDYKLKQAVSLSRQIGYRQLFASSKMYRPIFYNVMARLFGAVSIDGNTEMLGYNQVANLKTIQSVSNALSGFFRAKALENTTKHLQESNTEYTGPIDFTFNGDKEKASAFVHLLLYGAQTKEEQEAYSDVLAEYPHMEVPLFTRFVNFMSYLQNIPEEDGAEQWLSISEGIVNSETGLVDNDFLNYLKPIPPTKNFPTGQLLLRESAFNRSSDKESVLISSFSDLLNHKSPVVRRLARELAIYAYYTSYGQNSRDSFFDIVPLEFRVQYDQAIKDDLYNEKNIARHMGNSDANDGVFNYDELTDAIARNYWFNGDIIPVKQESSTINKHREAFNVGNDDIGLLRMRIKISDKRSSNTYGIIITNNINGDYFTVRHGQDTFLYKKVGEIAKSQTTSNRETEDGVSTQNTRHNVYFIIPKLGRHSQSNHHYELSNSSDQASVYEENQLPLQFEYGNLQLALKNWITAETPNSATIEPLYTERSSNAAYSHTVKPKNKNIKIGSKKYPVIEVTVSFEQTSSTQIAGDFSENVSNATGDNYTNSTGDVRALIDKGNPKEAVIKHRDTTFVLNFGQQFESDKIINIPKNATSEDITKAIKSWMSAHNITTDDAIGIGLIGDQLDVSVTKQEVEDFVKYQVALAQVMSEEDVDIEQVEKAAREQAEEILKLDKYTRVFGKAIQDLIVEGYTINTLHTTGDAGVEQGFVNAGRLLSDYLEFGQVYIHMPRSYMNLDNISKYERKMDMYDTKAELVVTKNDVEEALTIMEAQDKMLEIAQESADITDTKEAKIQKPESKEIVDEQESIVSEDKPDNLELSDVSLDDLLKAAGIDDNVFKTNDDVSEEAMNHCKNGGTE